MRAASSITQVKVGEEEEEDMGFPRPIVKPRVPSGILGHLTVSFACGSH